jgi:hypothetical protein
MSKYIDLGKKIADFLMPASPASSQDTHYPDLYLSDVDDTAIADMPDKGEAVIKYRVLSRTYREEKNGDKKLRSCSVRLEILSIKPPEGAPKLKSYGDDARKSFRAFYNGK